MSVVSDLPGLIAGLPATSRDRVGRLFEVHVASGRTEPPPEMAGALVARYGSLDAVRRQTVTRVRNRWSLEETLFSALRAHRPLDGPRHDAAGEANDGDGEDPFCDPLHQTPADAWGRVRGRHVVSGANAAKYDAHHAVLVFDRHDPLAFDEDLVVDLLEVGRAWAERTAAEDPDADAYLLTWNSGWRAGASMTHGHAQALLGHGHYGAIERLRLTAREYRKATGAAYLADLAAAHADLGLSIDLSGVAAGVPAVVASLTPRKERELLIIGTPGTDERDSAYARTVARVLLAYRDALGVRAFNLALQRPPLVRREGAADGWGDIGPVVRLVDRGDPGSHNSDIGAMELFAASVVSADPFEVADGLRRALG